MAKQLSFNFKKKAKAGRTAKGRIKKGFRLSACTGQVTKARKRKGRKK